MNNRAQIGLSKTGILFTVLIFYTVIFVMIGITNSYFKSDTTISQGTQTSGSFSFINNIISGISDIPTWLNTILFGSLLVIILWIAFSSLPFMNGGA